MCTLLYAVLSELAPNRFKAIAAVRHTRLQYVTTGQTQPRHSLTNPCIKKARRP
jgi:hypothetical protein